LLRTRDGRAQRIGIEGLRDRLPRRVETQVQPPVGRSA
jgi:hypothetical protein